ncbi:MAG: SIMPL domain-containing protein [Candidatus Nanoarchaeia archaeon]|jgi:hypothetical protein|nr:SIMPL domain-containing protein [Candidatus Nanoarchaeia archaeon]MDD3993808.1 SIMPL domain-containing protein [Candidatus Nanoarchaeia archaeon]MDD4563256.1 SIMPL domain-containing protein [Candidatus Nanoarchaeia archaeon]
MKENDKLKMTGLIIIGVILLTLIIIYSVYSFQPRSTINVEGLGEIKVTPNEINLNFNIEKNASTSKEATNLNFETTEKVKEALIAIGIAEEDIKTTNFNVYEEFDWSKDERKSLGYKASQVLTLKLSIDEKEKISQSINAAIENDATISYIYYSLSEDLEKETKALAINKATEDAKEKATEMTKTLSAKLGRIIQISDSYNTPSYYYGTYAKDAVLTESISARGLSEVSFNPDEQTVSASVSILYEIK